MGLIKSLSGQEKNSDGTAVYARYVFHEFLSPAIYVNAVIVGTAICFFTGHYSVIPYCVPLLMQVMARSSVKFRQRHLHALAELPAQIEDPAFIRDREGNVILSTGRTRQLFQESGVENIAAFVGEKGLSAILKLVDPDRAPGAVLPGEVHSEVTGKWYEVKANPAAGQHGEASGKVLVWFRDISLRKEYDSRLQDLLSYSSSMIGRLGELVKTGTIYDRLAAFMLSDYEAVYITRTDAEENLVGNVFKHGASGLEKSPSILVPSQSQAPILVSRRKSRILSGDVGDYDSAEAFAARNPFDPKVLEFIGSPIRNYITYNEADVSIIAFNHEKNISAYEKRFIEVLLNISRTMIMLVDLARENDHQFIQKVMGLCAAAEYSDEIAGNHVLRVNAYSRLVAEKMGMDPHFTETIGQVAALHDLGKVAMPELIKRTGTYTAEERRQMEMHTVFGARIIDTVSRYAARPDPRLSMARNIALHHHQTHNGMGYPRMKRDGRVLDTLPEKPADCREDLPLSGYEVPVEALIVGLADRYDALRSDTPDTPALSHEAAVAIMGMDDRLHIDGESWHGPAVWRIFLRHHGEFDRIFETAKEA